MKKTVNSRKRKQSQRNKNTILIISVLIVLAILFTVIILKFKNNEKSDEPTGLLSITADSLEKKMILSADSTNLFVGNDKNLELTLYVPDNISLNEEADVKVYDEERTLYGTMEPAESTTKVGYTEFTASIEIKSPKVGRILLHAEADGKESMELTLYCTPVITKEMVVNCYELGADLRDYLDENQIEEKMEAGKQGYSKKKVLKKVKKWLEQDARCMVAEINGPNVLYLTQDSILGAYTLPVEEGYLGSSMEEENQTLNHTGEDDHHKGLLKRILDKLRDKDAGNENDSDNEIVLPNIHNSVSEMDFALSNKEKKDSTEFSVEPDGLFATYSREGSLNSIGEQYPNNYIYQDGLNTITNKNFLIWGGFRDMYDNIDYTNLTDGLYYQYRDILDIGNVFASELQYRITEVRTTHILPLIINKTLQQNGIISLTTHGAYLMKDNNSFLSCYCILGGQPDKKLDADIIEERINLLDSVIEFVSNSDSSLDDDRVLSLFYCNATDKNTKIDANMARIFVEAGGDLYFTSNLLKDSCQNAFYDNSIFLVNCCYGILDSSMCTYLLNHGVKVIAGYEASINQTLSSQYAKLFLNRMLSKSEGNNRNRICLMNDSLGVIGKMAKGFISVWYGVSDAMKTDLETGLLIDYETNKAVKTSKGGKLISVRPDMEQEMLLYTNRPCFTVESYGNLKGKVLKRSTAYYYDKNGNLLEEKEITSPAKGIHVSSSRFLNQTFEDCNTMVITEEDGTFSIEQQIWGVLGLRVFEDSNKSTYADTTFTSSEFDAGEITIDSEGAEYDGYVAYMDADENQEVSAPGAEITFKLISAAAEKDHKKVGTESKIKADQEGHFNTGSLTAGTYEVIGTFQDGDFNYKGTFTLELKSGCSYFHDNPLVLDGRPRVIGTVYDEESGSPISDVSVSLNLNGQTYYAITDGNGNFVFRDLETGDAELVIEADGYESYSCSFYLDLSENLSNIQLQKITNYEIDDFFGYYLDGAAGMGLYKKQNSPSGVGYITFLVDATDPEPIETMHTINVLRTVTGYEINKNVLTLYTDLNTLVCVLNKDRTELKVTINNSTTYYSRVNE